MKNYNPKMTFKQRGLTLIELTVVLLILIGLAGLLLPYVSGFFQKTETSTSAANLAEVNNAIDRFETQYLAYPDGFDNLVAGLEGTAVINWLAGVGNVDAVPNDLEVFSMTDVPTAFDSLSAAEINSLHTMKSTSPVLAGSEFNATFAGTDANVPIAKTAAAGQTTKLVRIKQADLATLIEDNMGVQIPSIDITGTTTAGGTVLNDYVVFGVGQHTQMTGKTLKEAPVYFGGGVDNPTARYGRFLAVFQVPRNGTAAKYIGAMTPTLKTQSMITSTFHASIKDAD